LNALIKAIGQPTLVVHQQQCKFVTLPL